MTFAMLWSTREAIYMEDWSYQIVSIQHWAGGNPGGSYSQFRAAPTGGPPTLASKARQSVTVPELTLTQSQYWVRLTTI